MSVNQSESCIQQRSDITCDKDQLTDHYYYTYIGLYLFYCRLQHLKLMSLWKAFLKSSFDMVYIIGLMSELT